MPRTLVDWLSAILAIVLALLVVVGIYGSAIVYLRRRRGIGSRTTWFERAFDRLNDLVAGVLDFLWRLVRLPLLAGLGLLVLAWLIAVFYLPHADANLKDTSEAFDARATVSTFFAMRMPTAEIRLQQHGGFNLDIWISQRDIESVPYPDRKSFVQNIGRLWCEDAKIKTEGVFLPSVQIRDVHNGKELASYSCSLSRASIE